uniref:Uncharacterized protein n=1 Tax=Arundo donax TaxID=35708 RepID=A0A0A9F0E5_ARUDO
MGDKGKEQLCTGSNEESREKKLSVRKHQHRGGSNNNNNNKAFRPK